MPRSYGVRWPPHTRHLSVLSPSAPFFSSNMLRPSVCTLPSRLIAYPGSPCSFYFLLRVPLLFLTPFATANPILLYFRVVCPRNVSAILKAASLTPAFFSFFFLFFSLQALCGVAAGCTKTSITSHFALRANMADISAKENAQETAVNVCGMVSCCNGSVGLN